MAVAAFVALTIIASLNRETALIVPALVWAFYGFTAWRKLVVLTLVYAAVTIGLHIVLGSAPHMLGLEGTLIYNLQTIGDGLVINLVLLPLWAVFAMRFRYAPPILKRFAIVGVLYLAAIIVGGAWNEILRLGLPVIVLLLPIVLRGYHETPAR